MTLMYTDAGLASQPGLSGKTEERVYGLEDWDTPHDFLWYGLPCVWNADKYIVFSPYALKIARILPDALGLPETKQRLEQGGFFGQPARPPDSTSTVRFGLILTTGCNLRCKYCYVVPEAKPRMMSPECALRIIREKVKLDTEKISLSFFGGEATLNMPALKAAVEYVKGLGIPYQFLINTNGTAPDEDLDYLISNNFIFIVSSDETGREKNQTKTDLSKLIAAHWSIFQAERVFGFVELREADRRRVPIISRVVRVIKPESWGGTYSQLAIMLAKEGKGLTIRATANDRVRIDFTLTEKEKVVPVGIWWNVRTNELQFENSILQKVIDRLKPMISTGPFTDRLYDSVKVALEEISDTQGEGGMLILRQ